MSMALGVVTLDVFEFGGLLERRIVPVEMPQPFMKIWVA